MFENPIFHFWTTHIEIDVHFVREKVESGEIEIRCIPTAYQVAYIFTKGLSRDRFLFLCGKLGIKMSPVHDRSNDSTGSSKITNSSSVESGLRGNVEA